MTHIDRTDVPARCSSKNRFLRGLQALRQETGNSLVEVSLLISFFGVPLLLGVAEIGRVAYAGIEVSNAARAGAAFASQNTSDSTDNVDTKQAALNEASDLNGMTVSNPTITCFCANAPTTAVTCSSAATTCANNSSHAISFVTVNTSLSLSPIFHIPSLPSSFSLVGQQTMRIQ